jgi:hypothetical protein
MEGHAEVDTTISNDYPFSLYQSATQAMKPGLEAIVLAEVVRRSDGILDQEYASIDRCIELLQMHPDFRANLIRCMRAGSFQEVRYSGIVSLVSYCDLYPIYVDILQRY